MAFSPITLWQIEGVKVEAVTDFLFLSSKITANGNCSHEIRRQLLLDRKARQCVKKQRHHFSDSVPYSQGYGLPMKWQPTPVFLPGESQGRGSLVGCRLWGRTESDTTEAT